jgi:hypothetical protein
MLEASKESGHQEQEHMKHLEAWVKAMKVLSVATIHMNNHMWYIDV